MEFTANYTHGGFSTYANVAYSVAQGEDWNSAQFLFRSGGPGLCQEPLDLARPRPARHRLVRHVLPLEGRQRDSTRVYVDALYGTGLRTDAHRSLTATTFPTAERFRPITRSTSAWNKASNCTKKQILKARLDVVNLTDNSYELRDGSGVGVNAAQYGARIGFFGSISYVF